MRKTYSILLFFLCCSFIMAQNQKVLVAAHRGDWRNYADNSIEGIESCIRMGVDIVEIDVAKTKDGHLVLMHDKTVDRTTNSKGKVSDFMLEEICQIRLRNGLGRVTDFLIPTLEEVMLISKDRIMVNIDKGDAYFDDIYKILKKTGTVKQAIIKSSKSYEELKTQYGEIMDKMIFMQIITLKKETTFDSITPLLDKKYPYYEICFREDNYKLLSQIKKKLQEANSVIWMNSLWDSLNGGYSDDKALKDPDGTWGYLINELGAGVLQTDRPMLMLNYLKEKKLHN
ncbi:MAG: glycerophosphodiester phosphodiesterase family protein [Prevotella sp.]|nr:glycerophosphodiester phosphodiesterase family protein [Prevotella sp.]